MASDQPSARKKAAKDDPFAAPPGKSQKALVGGT
jgi:hypothetical protein